MNDKKKKKNNWKKYIMFVICLAICVWIGFNFGRDAGEDIKNGADISDKLLSWILKFAWAMVAMFMHIIIHEAGHLVFGLMSGYKFSAFMILSFMLLKENGKMKLKRVKVAGMGGQCLMIPPPMKNGQIPVILINIGGPLMNLAASIVSCVIFVFVVYLGEERVIAYDTINMMIVMFTLVGIITALLNGIPIKTKTINNDGYNALELRKSRGAMYGFWLQLQANAEIINGKRLKDLPESWFALPPDSEMKNSMVAVIAVYACNRLMDEGKFEEADKLIEHILSIESGIVGIYRNLLTCDRMYCEMIRDNRREVLDDMYTLELKKFMQTMKKFPSVLRTEYAYALLVEQDEEKAEKILKVFDKCAKSYPYESDIQMERELIVYAKDCVE